MRLRTKLVVTATGLTLAIVLVLSALFLGQLLHQRVEQTSAANDVLAQEVLLVTREAIETGLRADPPPANLPPDQASDALHSAVVDALRSSDALTEVMNAIVRYSPTVQDVSVTDAHGMTIVSTNPDAVDQSEPVRPPFSQLRDGSLYAQMHEVFGTPRVLDVSVPLDRNGLPFLVVHMGVRSTLLRASYTPWLLDALWIVLLAGIVSIVVAALLSTLALRPLQAIGEQLESLTLMRGGSVIDSSIPMLDSPPKGADPIGRVNRTIDRLGRQMRSQEEGYTALQANLDQMLDTLRDGVLLFTADRRAVMVSDAVAHFIVLAGTSGVATVEAPPADSMVGMTLEQIFAPETALGAAVLAAFESGRHISAETVTLEDGRQVQISLDRIEDARADAAEGDDADDRLTRAMGTLLTLRDTASAHELEQELEVSRRLAAIGRLTANVGHEVKNPINAMVVHLELLRTKLAAGAFDPPSAQRHVDILADEMHRLDRVVQTLADFSRPMELDLREHDLRKVIGQVVDLAGDELRSEGIHIEAESPSQPVMVRIDGELMRQALLNLMLNAMQAMPSDGVLRITLHRDQRTAVVEVADTGIGIPASVLPRIFDLYFTTKTTGSGIGLAMTYRILQLHGGAMEVRSNADPDSPERGTTFTLHLPIANAPVKEAGKVSARLAGGQEPGSAETPGNGVLDSRETGSVRRERDKAAPNTATVASATIESSKETS